MGGDNMAGKRDTTRLRDSNHSDDLDVELDVSPDKDSFLKPKFCCEHAANIL